MGHRGEDLKQILVPLVRAQYALRKRQVQVRTADPRMDTDIPCVAVNRIYDSEDNQGFNNFYQNELDGKTGGNVTVYSGLFTQNVELRIWTEDADQRDDMFTELKEILILLKPVLASQGFGSMRVFSGRDENDFRTYSPLFIYWGVLQFTALSPLDAFNPPDTTATIIETIDVVQEDVQLNPEA